MNASRCASAALVFVTLAAAQAAAAQPAIDRLTIVAPAAPGGGWDQTARVLQHVLEADRLVSVVEVQNVPGAAGTIGLSQFINNERGNGRALLVSGLVMLGATVWNRSPVSVTQVTPIARLTGEFEVIAVPAASPHRDLRSLVNAFRDRPEAFSWGGGSAGGTDHILTGLLAEAAGIDARRVNYIAFSGGGEAVAALLGGHVTAGISGYSEFAPHIAAGRLHAIAISAPARVTSIDVDTLKEGGIDVELMNWRAVLAPARISGDERSRLTSVIRQTTQSQRWREVLIERGWTDMYLDGAAFDEYLRAERIRLTRIIARLRGPGDVATASVGQRIVPIVVIGGALIVLLALVVRGVARGSEPVAPDTGPDNTSLALVCAALAAFAALLPAFGFIVAASALFAATASAFRRGAGARVRAAHVVLAAVVFNTIVYLTFTRGLDLSLPAGLLWTWMR